MEPVRHGSQAGNGAQEPTRHSGRLPGDGVGVTRGQSLPRSHMAIRFGWIALPS